jgi:S-adenosylmethionine-diacylgycerolhomoserine-N-methlytransferase
MDQVQAMDRMYRYQRYIYDFTRKYYLFGRDTLIRRMEIKEGEQVLEMGCGTARNLLLLAQRHPQTDFYGIDASHEMLHTASTKIKTGSYAQHIVLKQCLAENVSYQQTFNLTQPFDVIFFSYSLSMIPPWREALQAGLDNLKTGGYLYIVDFSDQRQLPVWFRHLLTRWLNWFGVHYKVELLTYLHTLHNQGDGKLSIEGLGGHYAFIAKFQKT